VHSGGLPRREVVASSNTVLVEATRKVTLRPTLIIKEHRMEAVEIRFKVIHLLELRKSSTVAASGFNLKFHESRAPHEYDLAAVASPPGSNIAQIINVLTHGLRTERGVHHSSGAFQGAAYGDRKK
jgi:hypothetical protein